MKCLFTTLPLLAVAVTGQPQSSNSVEEIFGRSKEMVSVMEEKSYEVVYLDFNILTESDNLEENILEFNSGNTYMILAYGDPRIATIKLQMYEAMNSKWELFQEGKPLSTEDSKAMNYTSTVVYTPKQEQRNKILVEAMDFRDDATSGRFFVLVGVVRRPAPVEVYSSSCQDVRFTRRRNEIVRRGAPYSCNSRFVITEESVKQIRGSQTITYSVTSKEKADDSLIYSCVADNGRSYVILVNATGLFIDIYEASTSNSIPGNRYFLGGG